MAHKVIAPVWETECLCSDLHIVSRVFTLGNETSCGVVLISELCIQATAEWSLLILIHYVIIV